MLRHELARVFTGGVVRGRSWSLIFTSVYIGLYFVIVATRPAGRCSLGHWSLLVFLSVHSVSHQGLLRLYFGCGVWDVGHDVLSVLAIFVVALSTVTRPHLSSGGRARGFKRVR